MKCIAIDDEPIALSIIEAHCARYGGVELEYFTSPVEGMARVAEARPDIVFLDIEMNSHNGITLARELPKETCLIFTTAYSEYAFEGFEVNAVDFLHKPIFYPRFEKAMEKAKRWLSAVSSTHSPTPSISLKADYKNVVVEVADILYIEAMDNYVKVYRRDQPMVVSQITMKEMESMLPGDAFIRIHRSYIVAANAVETYTTKSVTLKGKGLQLPVGRTYVGEVGRLGGC